MKNGWRILEKNGFSAWNLPDCEVNSLFQCFTRKQQKDSAKETIRNCGWFLSAAVIVIVVVVFVPFQLNALRQITNISHFKAEIVEFEIIKFSLYSWHKMVEIWYQCVLSFVFVDSIPFRFVEIKIFSLLFGESCRVVLCCVVCFPYGISPTQYYLVARNACTSLNTYIVYTYTWYMAEHSIWF